MSSNPFRFGTPVEIKQLIGRDREQDETVRMFTEARNLALVAPRGTGKTSLLHAALAAWREKAGQTIYVDLFPAINTRRFAEIYASALTLGPTTTVESMREAVQHLVPSVIPRVTIDGAGKPGLQLDLWDRDRDMRALLERILDAPAQLAGEDEPPSVIVFDDFEDLLGIGESDLLQSLAQAVRRHRHVCYVFVLRREGTAERTFNTPKSPFYRLADAVRLDSVPREAMARGMRSLFQAGGVSVEPEHVDRILEYAQHVPHNAQMLAHALFEETRDGGRVTEKGLRAALSHVLDAGAYAYKFQWDQLAPHQRNLVLAVAQGYTERLQSQKIVFQLGLGSPSTVSKNLRALMDREILQKREGNTYFVDPFFGLWLQRRMT